MSSKIIGYEQPYVIAFLDAHGERNDEDRFCVLNRQRVLSTVADMLARWEAKPDVRVHLGRLDELLIAHGLMLCEFEHWCEQQFGSNGFVDPTAEPAELVI